MFSLFFMMFIYEKNENNHNDLMVLTKQSDGEIHNEIITVGIVDFVATMPAF